MSRPPSGWSGLCYAVQTIMQKIKLRLATLLGFLLRNLCCNNKLLVVNKLLNFLQKRDIHYINRACYCEIRLQMLHMWFEWNQQNQAKTQHKMERNFTELKAKVCSSPTYFMNSMIWDVGTLNGFSVNPKNQITCYQDEFWVEYFMEEMISTTCKTEWKLLEQSPACVLRLPHSCVSQLIMLQVSWFTHQGGTSQQFQSMEVWWEIPCNAYILSCHPAEKQVIAREVQEFSIMSR